MRDDLSVLDCAKKRYNAPPSESDNPNAIYAIVRQQ